MGAPNNNTSYWSEGGIFNRIFNEGNGSINAEVSSSNSGITPIASSLTAVTLKAANNKRKGVIINNNSTATLYVAFGTTASLTTFSFKIGPGGIYETVTNNYTGIISGIWDAVNGNALITELT